MRRSPLMAPALTLGLCVVIGASLGAQAPDGQAIWDKVVETYADADEFAADGTISANLGFFDLHGPASWAFKRPNKFRMTHTMHGSMGDWGRRTVVSNGVNTYERIEISNEYHKSPAPASFAEFIERVESLTNMGLVSVGQLLAGIDVSEKIESVTYLRSGRYLGTPVHLLDLKLKREQMLPESADEAAGAPGDTQRVWVGQNDSLIYKSRIAIDMSGMMDDMLGALDEIEAGVPDDDGEGSMDDATAEDIDFEAMMREMVEAMMEAFGDQKTGFTERYRNVRINEGLPPGTFNFHLRPGEKRVRTLSEPELVEDDSDAGLFGGPAPDAPDMGAPMPSALVGTEAPDFTLADLDGNLVTLSDLRGDPVLVDFWASWCGPCLMELPHIQQLHQEYADGGLQVVGISGDAEKQDAVAAVKEMGLTFTVLWQNRENEADLAIDTAYNVTAIPRLVLIDADGTIVADVIGYHDKADLVEMLKKVGIN